MHLLEAQQEIMHMSMIYGDYKYLKTSTVSPYFISDRLYLTSFPAQTDAMLWPQSLMKNGKGE